MRTARIIIGALAAAAVLAPTGAAQAAVQGSQNDRLVENWYGDLLGRPDFQSLAESGRGYWVDRLDQGTDRVQVLRDIEASPEFASYEVSTTYRAWLGRDASTDRGADVWRTGLQRGMEPEWLEQNVLASSEFVRARGANPIDEWYSIILARQPHDPAGPGEEAYWQGRVRAVGTLGAVREIWYSPEAVRARIVAGYGLLSRTPSDGEVSYWYATVVAGRQGFLNQVLASSEYGG